MAATDPMPETHLHAVLRDAVDHAVGLHPDAEGKDQRVLHRGRSQAFVAGVAEAFRQTYAPMPDVRVFWRGNPHNQPIFGLNELLYDITVCRVETVPPGCEVTPLSYVTKALWLVESEFVCERRKVLLDFSKLVIGRAENKLFIGSHFKNDDELRGLLAEPAACCVDPVHLALVQHPSKWGGESAGVEVYRFVEDDNRWDPVV